MGFARETGAGSAELLAYAASADISLAGGGDIPDSFVGYAAIGWRPGTMRDEQSDVTNEKLVMSNK
jgi:hypothetical protein